MYGYQKGDELLKTVTKSLTDNFRTADVYRIGGDEFVVICQNVDNCDFTYKYVDSKYAITVNFKTDGIDLTGNNAITYNL